LLIPAPLATVLTISEGGFIIQEGNRVQLLMEKLFAVPVCDDSFRSDESGYRASFDRAFIGGLALLIPSQYLLMRLFLFDAKYVKGK
jgi:hypothetical protein